MEQCFCFVFFSIVFFFLFSPPFSSSLSSLKKDASSCQVLCQYTHTHTHTASNLYLSTSFSRRELRPPVTRPSRKATRCAMGIAGCQSDFSFLSSYCRLYILLVWPPAVSSNLKS